MKGRLGRGKGGGQKNDEGDVAPNEKLYNYAGCGGDNCLKYSQKYFLIIIKKE